MLSLADIVAVCSEHDELRYSIRSAVASLPSTSLATLHLVVGDTPTYSPFAPMPSDTASAANDTRFAQIPHWLHLPRVRLSEPDQITGVSLLVHPHSELFKSSQVGEDEAAKWQVSVVPSFNRCFTAPFNSVRIP